MTMLPSLAPAGAGPCPCASDPDIRILKRVSTLQDFPLAPHAGGPIKRVGLVDAESTGTDPVVDEIIDIALVVVEVDERGEVVRIASAGQALRDPGRPIPAEICRLTGITDDDVRDKTIDLDRLERRIKSVDVVVAHNVRFDFAFLRDLMPAIADIPLGCSLHDIDWQAEGFEPGRLSHLLAQAGRFSGTAHRAMADVIALLHVLNARLPDGKTAMARLIENAARPTVRVEAVGAPYAKRNDLKAGGYRWDAAQKVWAREVAEGDVEQEEAWLRICLGPYGPPPRRVPVTWRERHR